MSRPRHGCVLTPSRVAGDCEAGGGRAPRGRHSVRVHPIDHPDVLQHIDRSPGGIQVDQDSPAQYDWDNFGYFPIYRMLEELGLVAVCFTPGIVAGSSDDPEPSSMAACVRPFSTPSRAPSHRLRIHGAHLGNPWYESAAEWRAGRRIVFRSERILADQEANDLAVFAKYLCGEGPTAHRSLRAVYAFESSCSAPTTPANLDAVIAKFDAMLDANRVPEASRRLIYGGTMARILGRRSGHPRPGAAAEDERHEA